MAGSVKVAIVTGSNKGIGYAIVKGLCERFQGDVYLTARSADRGNAAIDKLKQLGFNPLFHQLDVDNQESVDKFRDYIKQKYNGLDLLINNAAIAFNQDAKEPFYVQAAGTVKTNYFGLLRVCEAFFPLLRKDARVVNVSSSAGHLARIPSEELRSKLSDSKLTVQKLSDLMNEFLEFRQNDSALANGWNESAYVVSKVGVCALSRIQQRIFDVNEPKLNISVNSVHPGFVDTDMTNHEGVLTIEQGAKSSLFVALEQHSLKGEYIWDAKDEDKVKRWGTNTYVVSKVGVTALTRIQQRNFNSESPDKNISVNAVHPGYVDTDMTNHKGVLTIEHGASAPLFVALDAPNWKGEYVWSDSKIVDWLSPSPPSRI